MLLLLFVLLFYSDAAIIFDNNDISPFEKCVTNPVLLPGRINFVFIAISENCTLEKFQKMMTNYIELEKRAFIETSDIKDEWLLYVSIGDEKLVQIQNVNSMDEYFNATQACYKIYNRAMVKDVQETLSYFVGKDKYCDEKIRKAFALIVTDVCLYIDKEYSSINRPCMNYYRDVSLLYGTPDEYIECDYYITYKRPGDDDYIPDKFAHYVTAPFHLLNIDNVDDNLKTYLNMNVRHSSVPSSTLINLLVLVNNDFDIPYNIFQNIFLPNYICQEGTFFARLHYLFDNGTQQNFNEISLPINSKSLIAFDHFMWNYENLRNQSTVRDFDGKSCNNIKRFLEDGNNTPFDGEQYNILIVQDPYPSCLDFDLKWDNKNRHLEIIVLYSESIISNYSNFIKSSQDNLNHITFYNTDKALSDDIFDSFIDNRICGPGFIKVQPSSADMTENFSTTTNLPNMSSDDIFELELWHIIFIIIIFLAATAISIKLIFMLITAKKVKNVQNEILNKEILGKDAKIFETQTSNKYWKIFLDDKNVVIHFDCVLGKGSNSSVYKGSILHRNPFGPVSKSFKTPQNCNVAVKIPKHSNTDSNTKELINQLDALMLLKSHANIVKLLGWTLCGDIPVLITELASTNLLAHVQTYPNQLNFTKFALQILWQISNALKYVAEHKMIHRDIACRNILLMENNAVAKIADFGLCCKCDETGIFKDSKHEKFPLKWLSLEAILDGIFSEASDVWAFGILCCEVFTFGAVPYEGMSTSEMIEYVEAGKRLPKPAIAPNFIYDLMLHCWKETPSNRPSFNSINKKIAAYLEEDTLKYGYLALKKVLKKI